MVKDCSKCGHPFDDGGIKQRRNCTACQKNRNTARDAKAAECREHLTCIRCGTEYQGNIGRDGLCPGCHAKQKRIKDEHIVTFVGIDGEGMTGPCENKGCDCQEYVPVDESDPNSFCVCGHRKAAQKIPGAKVYQYRRGHRHLYVLLRCGDYVIENLHGLSIDEILDFLYDSARQYPPDTAFIIYSGGYDFTMWFRTLPEERAAQLILPEFAAERKKARRDKRTRQPWPVEYPAPKEDDWKNRVSWDRVVKWEMDYLPNRKFKFRPKDQAKWIPGSESGWIHVCDVFSFFQTSFAAAIDPAKYPAGEAPCTPEEYEDIMTGKKRRSHATLDDEMRRYNEMEVHVLERLMSIYNAALVQALHVRLKKDRWFGPGQIAVSLLAQWKAPKRKQVEEVLKQQKGVAKALIASYYGGWFEIMAHGRLPGKTYGYDINSAYPYIISTLPCPLHGTWKYGCRKQPPELESGQYRLAHVIVSGSDPYIGAMPHRLPMTHGIVRPHNTEGWYWQHELDASQATGLIDTITYLGYYTFTPGECPTDCSPVPCSGVEGLYNKRRNLAAVGKIKGKNTVRGIAYKLGYNSVYGKTAQSLGEPPYTNWMWASLITAGCRVMILNAIRTHPERTKAVTMVATDAAYFRSPHPTLPLSDKLGEWDETVYDGLTQIKPGVYVDDEKLEKIDRGESPVFKARGVSAKAFAPKLRAVVEQFSKFDGGNWPSVSFPIEFEYVNCTQVMRWGRYQANMPGNTVRERSLWWMAGTVFEGTIKDQNSNPVEKRRTCSLCRYPGDGMRDDNRHVHNHGAVYFDGEMWRTRVYKAGHMTAGNHAAPSIYYDETMSRAAESLFKVPVNGITPQGTPWDLAMEALAA